MNITPNTHSGLSFGEWSTDYETKNTLYRALENENTDIGNLEATIENVDRDRTTTVSLRAYEIIGTQRYHRGFKYTLTRGETRERVEEGGFKFETFSTKTPSAHLDSGSRGNFQDKPAQKERIQRTLEMIFGKGN